jgi:hypothetical protein
LIVVATLRALHEHDHKLAAYCPTCERWAVLDLEQRIAEGRGDYCFVGRKPTLQLLPWARHFATAAAGHEAAHQRPAPRIRRAASTPWRFRQSCSTKDARWNPRTDRREIRSQASLSYWTGEVELAPFFL